MAKAEKQETAKGESVKDEKNCVLCGMCKTVCPSFQSTKDEKRSPRGRSQIIKKEKEPDMSFYDCTLCGACTASCYIDVELPLRQQREKLVKAGKETEANKKMIENIRKHGNPFGEVKKGDKIDELYCC